MANRIQNPYGYATPIGSGLSSVVDAFMAAPTPEQRAAEAAKMHALQVGAQRDLAAAGYDTSRTTGQDLQNRANQAIYDGLDLTTPQAVNRLAVAGGASGYGNIGDVVSAYMANQPGMTLEGLDVVRRGAGDAFGTTSVGFREDQKRLDTDSRRDYGAKIYDVDQREAGADRRFSVETSPGAVTTLSPGNPLGVTTIQGNPTQATVQGKIGQDWINAGGDVNQEISPLTPLGAALDTDKPDSGQSLVIGKDGSVTFSQGGAGVEMPTKNISDNIGAQQSIESYLRTSKELREIAATDPTLFGTTGNVRRLFQAVAGQVDSGLQALNKSAPGVAKDADAVYEAALTDLSMAGINDPTIYDPNLTDIDKMAILAAYQAAAAIAGQEGRGLSNEDFAKFRTIVGDPTAWGATRQSFLAGLNRLDRLALAELNARRQALGQSPLDPNAAPQGAGEQKSIGGRNYVKVNGQWMEVLP